MFSGGIQPGEQGYGFRRQPVKPSGPGRRGRGLPETKEKRDIHEVTRRDTKRDGSAASTGLWPGNPAGAPSRNKSDGRRPHPGARASRPHAIPLRAAQFPCDAPADTLPAGTPWARPMQSPGAAAGRAGWWRLPRLCQYVCGRDARAPGWASSRDLAIPRSRSSPEPASSAATHRPDNPVHPVHRCSIDRTSRWICPVAASAGVPPASVSVR